jgi:pimeloyl-ACP methyl ester carboxylesterase
LLHGLQAILERADGVFGSRSWSRFVQPRAAPISEKGFHYAFTNNLIVEESKTVYDRYAVPVLWRIPFEGRFANFTPDAATTYNFANDDRAPLLFIAGGNDRILPPPCSRRISRRTPNTPRRFPTTNCSPAAATTLAARLVGELADFALNWAKPDLRAQAMRIAGGDWDRTARIGSWCA